MFGKSVDFFWKLLVLFCVVGFVYIITRLAAGYVGPLVPGLLNALSHWLGIFGDSLTSQPYILKRLIAMVLVIIVVLIYKYRNKS